MNNLPNRPLAHKINEKSIAIISMLKPDSWIVRESSKDYGIDLQFEIFNEEEQSTGMMFLAQVKGSEATFGDNIISCDFPVKTLNYALLFSIPFFALYTSTKSGKVKFVWLQKYVSFVLDKESPNWRAQKTVTIHFPEGNCLASNHIKIDRIVSGEHNVRHYYDLICIIEAIRNFCECFIENKTFINSWRCLNLVCAVTDVKGKYFNDIFNLPLKEGISEEDNPNFIRSIFASIHKNKCISDSHEKIIKLFLQHLDLSRSNISKKDFYDNLAAWIEYDVPY